MPLTLAHRVGILGRMMQACGGKPGGGGLAGTTEPRQPLSSAAHKPFIYVTER